jgi:nucleoside-diphosphate-sugar epimerase
MVTGASGFIGGSLCDYLLRAGYPIIKVMRAYKDERADNKSNHIFADLALYEIPLHILKNTHIIVHCAGRAHVPEDNKSDSLHLHRVANVTATERLARQAASAGVKRFIFISSIGVNGTETKLGRKFTASDPPAPNNAYTSSKYEAEQILQKISNETGLEVVIIRPPLVYGFGAPGNFQRLIQAINMKVPLPFGAIDNLRSIVALDNLIDLIVICLAHPKAPGQVFLVCDGEDVSTTGLIRRTAKAMGKEIWLIPIYKPFLRFAGSMLGKQEMVKNLCGSLQIDTIKTQCLLGWTPKTPLDQGLKKAVEGIN